MPNQSDIAQSSGKSAASSSPNSSGSSNKVQTPQSSNGAGDQASKRSAKREQVALAHLFSLNGWSPLDSTDPFWFCPVSLAAKIPSPFAKDAKIDADARESWSDSLVDLWNFFHCSVAKPTLDGAEPLPLHLDGSIACCGMYGVAGEKDEGEGEQDDDDGSIDEEGMKAAFHTVPLSGDELQIPM